MVDLEQQIAAWVDAESDGVAPVTVDEVVPPGHAPAPAALADHRRPRPQWLAWAAAAIVALVAAAAVVRSTGTDDPVPAARSDDGIQMTIPELGWTLVRPASWSTATDHADCGNGVTRDSTVITNQAAPPERAAASCGRAWEANALDVPGFVGIELGRRGTGGTTTDESTRRPIDLDDFDARSDGDPVEYSTIIDVADEPPAYIRVWIADDADPDDAAAVRRLVRSIAWPIEEWPDGIRGAATTTATGNPKMSTFLVCMRDRGYAPTMHLDGGQTPAGQISATVTWDAGDLDRITFDEDHNACSAVGQEAIDRFSAGFSAWLDQPGPSQSAADAQRDRVIPELAALPLRTRAAATEFFDATEGTWAITVIPNIEPDDNCTLGDPQGAYGTERICTTEYGEVLLVDPGGSVVRAYPMPGAVPTWLYGTKDAVYVGRVGDGGLPDSTIVRIDRRTLESKALVFPQGDPGVDVPWSSWPNWSVAPEGADLSKLVVVGDDSAGQVVDSTIGVTSIDLPAIEELFA